eukprot:9458892-Pyramimonas_sp.AAC.1
MPSMRVAPREQRGEHGLGARPLVQSRPRRDCWEPTHVDAAERLMSLACPAVAAPGGAVAVTLVLFAMWAFGGTGVAVQ